MLTITRLATAAALLAAAAVVAFAVANSAHAQSSYTTRMPNGDLDTVGPSGSGSYSTRMPNGDYSTVYTPPYSEQRGAGPGMTQQQMFNCVRFRGC